MINEKYPYLKCQQNNICQVVKKNVCTYIMPPPTIEINLKKKKKKGREKKKEKRSFFLVQLAS